MIIYRYCRIPIRTESENQSKQKIIYVWAVINKSLRCNGKVYRVGINENHHTQTPGDKGEMAQLNHIAHYNFSFWSIFNSAELCYQ